MHRRRTCGGAKRRRCGVEVDISLYQGHRRKARRHTGTAGDGRERRPSRRGPEGPSRIAPVRALHSAHNSESAWHDDAAGAAYRLLRVIEKLGLTVIEDTVYGFSTRKPHRPRAPDNCIADSLSKKVAPGLALGFNASLTRLRERIMAAVRSGGWTASGFRVCRRQRLRPTAPSRATPEADRRGTAPANGGHLAGFEVQANPKSYHLWLTLPPHWRSNIVAAAARRDIA
jgi:hypothetical protein